MWELYAFWVDSDNAQWVLKKSPAAGRVSAAGYRNGALLFRGSRSPETAMEGEGQCLPRPFPFLPCGPPALDGLSA